MIHVVLSDFTSDQLAKRRQAREDAESAALAPFREAEKLRQAGVEALHRDYQAAWAAGRYLWAIVLWFRILLAPGPQELPTRSSSTLSDAERILQSGDAGQRSVIDRLAAQLDDGWIALSGYTNHRGEIDTVLVGPEGVACIEVKALNAQLTIDGDEWIRRRIGRSGDVLDGPSAVLDMGGRSPSRQLNEPADHLRLWLQRHGLSMPIHRWVVLAHANSTLGSTRNLTVDAVVRTEHLGVRTLLAKRPIVPLTTHELGRIRELIERDHRHHAARRSKSSTASNDKVAPTLAQLPQETPEPVLPMPQHGGYAGIPKNPPRREETESLHQRRISQLAAVARRIAAGTVRDDQRDKLQAAISHDIVVREEPVDTPDLLEHVRREPAAEVVRQMIDDAMQVFEFADRSLVGLVVPVSVRYRSFGEDRLTRSRANEGNLQTLEHVLRKTLGAERVIFDRRLYAPSDLADLSAKRWRDYLAGLEGAGADAEAAATPMAIDQSNHGRWLVVCIVGVAVRQPDSSDAVRWARIPLPRLIEDQLQMAMIELDPKRMVFASTEESASWGLWTLPAGLRAAASASHRIAMGLQGQSSSTYSTPWRLVRETQEPSQP